MNRDNTTEHTDEEAFFDACLKRVHERNDDVQGKRPRADREWLFPTQGERYAFQVKA
jgi:hypothetical protein